MFISDFDVLLSEWHSRGVRNVVTIFSVYIILVLLLMLIIGYSGKFTMRQTIRVALLFYPSMAFIVSLLPPLYSVVLFIAICALCEIENCKKQSMLISDEQKGITATTQKARNVQQKNFQSKSVEEQKQWYEEYQSTVPKPYPFWLVFGVQLVAYLLGFLVRLYF